MSKNSGGEWFPEYVCRKCGDVDIQSAMWTDPNTLKTSSFVSCDTGTDLEWCARCEEHGTVSLIQNLGDGRVWREVKKRIDQGLDQAQWSHDVSYSELRKRTDSVSGQSDHGNSAREEGSNGTQAKADGVQEDEVRKHSWAEEMQHFQRKDGHTKSIKYVPEAEANEVIATLQAENEQLRSDLSIRSSKCNELEEIASNLNDQLVSTKRSLDAANKIIYDNDINDRNSKAYLREKLEKEQDKVSNHIATIRMQRTTLEGLYRKNKYEKEKVEDLVNEIESLTASNPTTSHITAAKSSIQGMRNELERMNKLLTTAALGVDTG